MHRAGVALQTPPTIATLFRELYEPHLALSRLSHLEELQQRGFNFLISNRVLGKIGLRTLQFLSCTNTEKYFSLKLLKVISFSKGRTFEMCSWWEAFLTIIYKPLGTGEMGKTATVMGKWCLLGR